MVRDQASRGYDGSVCVPGLRSGIWVIIFVLSLSYYYFALGYHYIVFVLLLFCLWATITLSLGYNYFVFGLPLFLLWVIINLPLGYRWDKFRRY